MTESGNDENRHRPGASYDSVAPEYAGKFFGELQYKPFDRALLDRFANGVKDIGPVCDLGCGPGQIARYLQGRGVVVLGIDLSPGMVEVARRLNPDIRFLQADMRDLPAEDSAWGGIAAFYSIVHIPRQEVTGTLKEFKRVLKPAGQLLLAFHIGEETIHLDEWWEKPVSLDFYFFKLDEMEHYLEATGFEVVETQERPPYEEVEHPSRRGYILAQIPV